MVESFFPPGLRLYGFSADGFHRSVIIENKYIEIRNRVPVKNTISENSGSELHAVIIPIRGNDST